MYMYVYIYQSLHALQYSKIADKLVTKISHSYHILFLILSIYLVPTNSSILLPPYCLLSFITRMASQIPEASLKAHSHSPSLRSSPNPPLHQTHSRVATHCAKKRDMPGDVFRSSPRLALEPDLIKWASYRAKKSYPVRSLPGAKTGRISGLRQVGTEFD